MNRFRGFFPSPQTELNTVLLRCLDFAPPKRELSSINGPTAARKKGRETPLLPQLSWANGCAVQVEGTTDTNAIRSGDNGQAVLHEGNRYQPWLKMDANHALLPW